MPSEKLEKSRILQRIAAGEGLASPSPVVIRLLELAADDRSSITDLAKIIEQDPSLTVRLLKVANSAFFSGPRKAASVSQAILFVGYTRVRVMALSLSLRSSFPLGKAQGLDYEYFWKTSLYRAFIAQGLSQQMQDRKTTPAEEVFTAGLLQEIGMLMLYQVCPESLKEAFPAITEPLEDIISWEEQAFDLNHRQIGRFVLKRWGFPEAITESQRHYGSDALAKGRPALTQVLEFARLAAQVLFGEQPRFELFRDNAPMLNLHYDQIADTLCTSFAKVAEIAQHFQLQVDATQDIVEVIEKANRTLVRINDSLHTNLDKAIQLLSEGPSQGEKTLTQTLHDQQRAVGNVLDAVAHQIRNPLMAIGGFAQRLARQVEGQNLPSRYLNIILQESERLQQVLREVSSFSKEFTPARDEADLTAILDESIDELEGSTECRNVAFTRRFPTDVHLSLQLDQPAIKRALQVILKAIADLAGAPKSKAEVMIRIRDSSSLNWVMVDFCAESEVFQGGPPQTLLDADFSSKTLGKGLDFLEAWKIVESHGGKIEFENTSDGRHLIVSLPV